MIWARKFNGKKGNFTLKKGNFIEDLWKHWSMTTTLNTSCSENTIDLSARRGVSACMYFLVR